LVVSLIYRESIGSYKQGGITMSKNIHVSYGRDKSWEVKYSGEPSPIKRANSLDDAIKYSKPLAKSDKCVIIIHKENGEIQDQLSYK